MCKIRMDFTVIHKKLTLAQLLILSFKCRYFIRKEILFLRLYKTHSQRLPRKELYTFVYVTERALGKGEFLLVLLLVNFAFYF